MVLIRDIEPKTGNHEVIAEVVDIGQVREFEKEGKSGRVATATIKDESGLINLSLWNEQIDLVSLGDRIHIKNAWCDEFREEKKISTGKYGTLEVISGNERVTEFFGEKQEEKSDEEQSRKILSDENNVFEEFLDSDENI
ncbi:hypothetical protein GOV05_04710 [Candidatus Woesearchaeota archaeon]|nr:hypothetical protein [Candidatus Woesearchaeota archaeon]